MISVPVGHVCLMSSVLHASQPHLGWCLGLPTSILGASYEVGMMVAWQVAIHRRAGSCEDVNMLVECFAVFSVNFIAGRTLAHLRCRPCRKVAQSTLLNVDGVVRPLDRVTLWMVGTAVIHLTTLEVLLLAPSLTSEFGTMVTQDGNGHTKVGH